MSKKAGKFDHRRTSDVPLSIVETYIAGNKIPDSQETDENSATAVFSYTGKPGDPLDKNCITISVYTNGREFTEEERSIIWGLNEKYALWRKFFTGVVLSF